MASDKRLYSGATPSEVADDLKALVAFKDEGMSREEVKTLLDKHLVPHLMKYNLESFQAFFNSFPEEGADIGAEIALQYNQGVTNWQVSPGGATLEELCCNALCRLFNFPGTSDATFMYSGTYANQQAVFLALHKKAEQHGFNLSEKGIAGFDKPEELILITTKESHFSLKHAVRILGLGEQCLRFIPVDSNFRLDYNKLNRSFGEFQPDDIVCVFLTAGTTSTGAVDPVLPVAELCRQNNIWLHVDGAYGFAYSLVPGYSHLFEGYEQADSVTWDPHKQMGIPIPNSLLFVKDKKDFHRMAVHADYFNPSNVTEPNPGTKSPPSTRPLSALPLVSSVLFQGLKGLRKRLESPLLAVRQLYDYLAERPDFQTLHTPDTGILCFRYRPVNLPEEKTGELQKYIYGKILSEGIRSVSLTSLHGQSALRLLALTPSVSANSLIDTVHYIETVAKSFHPR